MIFQKPKKEQQAYGIIGLGRFGSALAMELVKKGMEILVIDSNEETIKEFRNYTENAYIIKSLDKNALSETGIQNCDVAVVCLGSKMDTSILATLYLNSLGIPKVIAKANSLEHGEILEKLGAEVVYPERDMAVRLASRLEPSKIISYLELSEKLNIFQVKLPEWCYGKSVQEMDIRKRFGLNIIAVEHQGEFHTKIHPEYSFAKEDTIVVIGNRESIMEFEQVK